MPINDDMNCNDSNNPHFQDVLKDALKDPSRRNMLRGGLGLASLFALPMLPGCGGATATNAVSALPAGSILGFNAVTKSILDQVVVPSGYTVKVLHATGDRLVSSIPAYSNTGAETDDWSQRVGDHHDGMDIYYVDSNGRYSATATSKAVLAMNHESSADSHLLHPRGQTSGGVNGKKFTQFGDWDVKARPGLEVLKEINLHGMFVNIQHPGENTVAWGPTATSLTTESTWPGNGGGLTAAHGPAGRPRSATLIITKNDGGKVGL